MRVRACCAVLALALTVALGCGGNEASTPSAVSVAVSPGFASVFLNKSLQFATFITGTVNTEVTWDVNGTAGGSATLGTIDENGLYTAPSTIPSPATVTITATSKEDTSASDSALLTIISGVRISVAPTAATLGTGEHFTFTATVTNPGCDPVATPTCLDVTWSVPAGSGTIDATGTYTAPATTPSPATVTITATAAADTTVTATVTATISDSVDPTLTSVSPKTAARGSLFQDVFLTGTNFTSTTAIFLNGTQLNSQSVFRASPSVLRVRLSAETLSAPPGSGILELSAARQTGAVQTCAPDVTQCQVIVVGVRPGLVGPSPDSIAQGTSGTLNFNVNGGFFGTAASPAVAATYDGGLRAVQFPSDSDLLGKTRRLSMTIGGAANPGDLGTPGLHPITVRRADAASVFAAANLAVQPDYAASSITSLGVLPVGTTPGAVDINPATGIAVVTNAGSHDITLVDLTGGAPSVLTPSLCTGEVGTATAPCAISSGPRSVAVDYVRNLALVANTASSSVAVINLATGAVTAVIATQDPPAAVGVNSVTGRALVAVQTRNYGLLIDLTLPAPAIVGTVSIVTGPEPHIAVEPRLNWAVATPGNVGSLGIVDLSRQTTNVITNISRTSGTVTVTVQGSTVADPQPPLAVVPGDAVLIQGISDTTFNGIYTVIAMTSATTFTYSQVNDSGHPNVASSAVTGQASYARPVATAPVTTAIQGIGINPETQNAVLLDPSAGGNVLFFNLLDQALAGLPQNQIGSFTREGNIAGAFNPLTNVAVVVNQFAGSNQLAVIDASTPRVLTTFTTGPTPVAVAVDAGANRAIIVNRGDNTVAVLSLGVIRPLSIAQTSPKTFENLSTLAATGTPAAQTLTVLGSGFVSGGSQVRLDGINLATTFVSDRKLTAVAPAALLSTARRFAVDVENPGGIVSNFSDFTVIQSVDVAAGTGCTEAPRPTGVGIDTQQNIAVVSLFGCNTAALINLSTGTGSTVSVGSNPFGVAVLQRSHSAVVANNGSDNASIINVLGGSVTNTVATGARPMGVAVNEATGEAAVANSVANTITFFDVASPTATSIATGQRPVAVAFNYTSGVIGVAAASGNSVSFGAATDTTLGTSFTVSLPTSLVYDPAGNNFLAPSSTGNRVHVLDPVTGNQSSFGVGINPSVLAYNYRTSTLVSANTVSHTLTVVDFLDRRVRTVLSLPAAPPNSTLGLSGDVQFGLDIHPFTNLIVIADAANGKVLMVPAPR